jgi:hypothetical protein
VALKLISASGVIQARLDQLLAGLPEPATQPAPHPGEIMTLVNDLDTTVTRDEPVVPSSTS